ncbi:MAG: ornithine carbamoyltransferase [Peptococcaceae bacterium]|jgi:ornithine carbamoyltransferase|nr:ornithine carbamoyltransferase [Peptococcaceae bacterium]MBQ2431786.1 ornithine carbamoyltransferase [Peptococcaceae bacterium]MBQ5658182.1 ornithine carbamoyltransferase [Peptococcaceae bacterium]
MRSVNNLSLKGRDFLTLKDFTRQEIEEMVNLGIDLKAKQKAGIPTPILAGKTLGMIFQKSSTRTRVSFEVGMYQLGGSALFLSTNDLQIGRGEPIKDTARVLSRYLDGIMIRTYSHADVEELAEYADIPVINGLTDDYHPTQIIADLITIQEHKGKLEGIKFAYVGDGNNMTHSLMIGCAKVGMDVTVACPDGYMPNPEIVALAQGYAAESGGSVTVMHDPKEAVKDVDVVYTDTWASMGQEAEKEIRKKAFAGYQVDDAMMALAKPDAIFMHCLPAYRGMEVTDEVIESPQSVVFDEAENRLHAHKAIMASVM